VAPLKLTVLPPWVVPNPDPAIVTTVPVLPEVGLIELMLSPEVTVKEMPLLATPATVTTMFPVVAPLGTGTTICPSLQLAGVPVVPLNLTVLVPGVAPKPAPTIVMVAPIPPLAGATLVIPGPVVTVNVELLLGPLFTVTTTGPVVAPAGIGALTSPTTQLVGVARTPLKVSVLAP